MSSQPEQPSATSAPAETPAPRNPPRTSIVTRLFLAAGSLVLVLVGVGVYIYLTQEKPLQEGGPTKSGPEPVKIGDPLRTLEAQGAVEVLAFSPDGKRIAWGTSEGGLQLRDLVKGEGFAHKGPAAVTGMAFIARGKTWLTAYANGTLEARDALTGALVQPPPVKQKGIIRALAYSSGAFMWIAAANSPDGKTGKLVWQDEGEIRDRDQSDLANHQAPIWSLAFSTDEGQRLVTGGDQGAIKLWDPATGQFEKTLKVGVEQVRSVAFAPEREVAVACIKSVELWSFDLEELRLSLPAEKGEIRCVACSKDGVLLAWGDGPTVKIWDVPRGRCLAVLTGHTQDVQALAFTADGTTLATGSKDRTIRLWDLKRVNADKRGDH
jgi:WD40 repeat protein